MRLLADGADLITGSSQLDTWLRFIIIMVGIVVTGYTQLKGFGTLKEKTDNVSAQATRAATLAEPTGNGYAKRTEEALNEIKVSLLRVETKVDTHIMDHAKAGMEK